MTFFETQIHLPQYRPDPRDSDLNALIAPQIFLQFRQRPIRLILHPRSQILNRLAGNPALPAPLPRSRRSILLPGSAENSRDALGPAYAYMKPLGQQP